jgi:hypothetical protein
MKLTGRGAEVSEGGGRSSMTVLKRLCEQKINPRNLNTYKNTEREREREREREGWG